MRSDHGLTTRRKFLGTFGAGLGAVVIAACSSQSVSPTAAPVKTGGGATTSAAPTAAPAAASTSTGGKTQIVLAHYLDPDAKAVYDTEIKAFSTKFPTISVREDVSPESEFTGKMLTQFGGGNYPDLMMLTDRYVPDFAEKSQLYVLDEYTKRDAKEVNVDDMNKDLVQSGNWKGQQLGYFDYTGPLISYINTRLWKEAGVEVPTGDLPGENMTFDQLTEIGKKVTHGDGPNKTFGIEGFGSNFCILCFIAWSFGTQLIPGRGPHAAAETKWTWNTQQMRQAMQMQTDWVQKDGSSPKPGTIQGDAFVAERTAIKNFSGRWLTPQYSKLPWVENLAMIMAPTGPTGTKQSRNGPRGLFIPKGAKYRDQAWELLKFINSPEGETMAFAGQYGTPPRHSLWDAFEKTKMPWENVKIYKKSQDIMEAGGALPTYPKFFAMNKIIVDQTTAMFLGKQSVEQTLQQMETQMNAQMQAPV